MFKVRYVHEFNPVSMVRTRQGHLFVPGLTRTLGCPDEDNVRCQTFVTTNADSRLSRTVLHFLSTTFKGHA